MKHLKNFSKEKIIQLFLIFSYVICWFSISTSLKDIFLVTTEFSNLETGLPYKKTIIELINFLRHGFVYICLFFLIIIFLFFNFNKNNYKKNNFIFYILIIYFLLQIPGLIFTENSIYNSSLIISSITIILTIILINNFFNDAEKDIFLITSFTILFIILSLSIYPKIIDLFQGVSMYGGYQELSSVFAGKASPRSSGLARTTLIIFILLNLISLRFFKLSYLLIIFRILLLLIILLFQSRIVIALTLFSLIIIFIYDYKFSIKDLTKYIFFYFFIPILLFYNITNFSEKKAALHLHNLDNLDKGIELTDTPDERFFAPQIRLYKKTDLTSGRLNDWILIKKNFDNKKILLGYGAQADRYLINQSASNGLIYSFISSGIIGLIFFSLFSLIIFSQSLKIITVFYKRNNYQNYLLDTLILVILGRSLVETSYAVFGIDLIILITTLILKKTKLKES